MSSPLIERLLNDGHAVTVDDANLDAFLRQHPHSLLFFAGDVRRFPESNDLAVILPELHKAFAGAFHIGLVANEVGPEWQKRYGFSHWPALVMLRGDAYLGSISKLQNWAVYCDELQRLLQSEPSPLPGLALPVID